MEKLNTLLLTYVCSSHAQSPNFDMHTSNTFLKHTHTLWIAVSIHCLIDSVPIPAQILLKICWTVV